MKMTKEEREQYIKLDVPKPVVIGQRELTDEEKQLAKSFLEDVIKKERRNKKV